MNTYQNQTMHAQRQIYAGNQLLVVTPLQPSVDSSEHQLFGQFDCKPGLVSNWPNKGGPRSFKMFYTVYIATFGLKGGRSGPPAFAPAQQPVSTEIEWWLQCGTFFNIGQHYASCWHVHPQKIQKLFNKITFWKLNQFQYTVALKNTQWHVKSFWLKPFAHYRYVL